MFDDIDEIEELRQAAEQNRRRSRRALAISLAGLVLMFMLAVGAVFYALGQNVIGDLARRGDCRAVLSARYDGAQLGWLNALTARDQATADAKLAEMGAIKDLREKSDPCRAEKQLP